MPDFTGFRCEDRIRIFYSKAEKIEADKKRERERVLAKIAEAKSVLAEYEGLSMEEVGK